MSSEPTNAEQPFQPGQLGLRHLLGLMTVLAIVAGISAARLRTLTPIEAAQVGIHWLLVTGAAGGTFWFHAIRRRRNDKEAGRILLRALQRPVNDTRQRVIRWLLTLAVIADGVFISTITYPSVKGNLAISLLGYLSHSLQFWMIEVMLWGACANHWLKNVDWIEFRENGILLNQGYIPWKNVTRLFWSPAIPGRLGLLTNRHHMEINIAPASRPAVEELMQQLQANPAKEMA